MVVRRQKYHGAAMGSRTRRSTVPLDSNILTEKISLLNKQTLAALNKNKPKDR
jgi:hypothetical protein